MRRLKIFSIIGGLSFLTYVLSYVLLSRDGHYEPAVYGLIAHPSGEAVLAPKSIFGYDWNPYGMRLWRDEDVPRWLSTADFVYAPLIYLDRSLVHRNKSPQKIASGKYRVKGYFDYTAFEYMDLNLD